MSFESSYQIPKLVPDNILLAIVQQLINPRASQEGGNSFFAFTLVATTDDQLVLKTNPFRKTLTVFNTDPALTVFIRRLYNGVLAQIPVPPLSGVGFDMIKLGTLSRCVNQTEIQQDLLRCEFMGELRLDNPNGVPIDVVVVEVA